MMVLDASVILKWVLPAKADSASALALRDRHVTGDDVVFVPDLLLYEAANVLTTTKGLSPKAAEEAWSHLGAIELGVYGARLKEMRRAMEISRKCQVSVYDATYAALAEALGCPLVTADRKVAQKLAKLRIAVEIA